MIKLSIITPTYNSENVIGACLKSVAGQNYPKQNMEVVIVDAGSKDKTLEIIKGFAGTLDIRLFDNPLKTGEAGKAVGIENARGAVIGLIDSDNILADPEYINKMMKPLEEDRDIFGSEPLYWEVRKQDKPLTRYFALSGVNDPLCLYVGNYDKYSWLTGKWTGMKIRTEKKEGYFTAFLEERAIPTIGANGTFLRLEEVKKTAYKPYMFDIDVVYEILKNKKSRFAKVDCGIVHIYSPDIASFTKKQSRRIKDFMFFDKEKKRSYPWASFPMGGVLKFSLYCITIVPLMAQAFAGFVRRPTWVWVFHPVVCEATFFIYAVTFMRTKITGKHEMKDRNKW
ncbi:MAG: glycosyltransferase family 2 protein [Spirochaetia bacterium]|nr:glycosyltransferase family 2 protein [Spirochaetia bacterium]